MKRLLVAAVAVAMVASAEAARSAVPDQRLADALVVAKADVPEHWLAFRHQPDPLLDCIANSAPGFTARARAIVGTPNSSVSSLATVMRDRSSAQQQYRRALATVRRCVRQVLTGTHPSYVWDTQPLSAARYGRQSSAWRTRFLRGYERHAVDWAVVVTGRAVLVDVFEMGLYDMDWNDISASRGLGGSARSIERRVLANAIRRAAAA